MNMSAVISKHNKKILRGSKEEEVKNCNCQGGLASCPVEGRCREKGVMYKAVISAQGEEDKQYIGATATEFKKRWANHKKSMRLERYRHETTLSSKYWEMKEKGLVPQVRWEIVRKARPYTPTTGRCGLCSTEKAAIILADREVTLNSRNEVMGRCRHRNQHLLANWRGRPPEVR